MNIVDVFLRNIAGIAIAICIIFWLSDIPKLWKEWRARRAQKND